MRTPIGLKCYHRILYQQEEKKGVAPTSRHRTKDASAYQIRIGSSSTSTPL